MGTQPRPRVLCMGGLGAAPPWEAHRGAKDLSRCGAGGMGAERRVWVGGAGRQGVNGPAPAGCSILGWALSILFWFGGIKALAAHSLFPK